MSGREERELYMKVILVALVAGLFWWVVFSSVTNWLGALIGGIGIAIMVALVAEEFGTNRHR